MEGWTPEIWNPLESKAIRIFAHRKNLGLPCSLQIGSKLRYLHYELSNHRVTLQDCCDNHLNVTISSSKMSIFTTDSSCKITPSLKALITPDYMFQLTEILHHQNFPHRQKSLAFSWTGFQLRHQHESCHIVKLTQQDWYSNHCWWALARQLPILYNSEKKVKSVRCKIEDMRSQLFFISGHSGVLVNARGNIDQFRAIVQLS